MREHIQLIMLFIWQAKKRAEDERKQRERDELEREIREYERKEAKRQETIARLEKLRRDIQNKQFLYMCREAILAENMNTIDLWDNQDYDYIEHYFGTEYKDRIMELDKARKLREAIMSEQEMMESLESRRQELLLKLEQAHQQFMKSLKDEEITLELYSQISHAFVYSYFECNPDLRLESLAGKLT